MVSQNGLINACVHFPDENMILSNSALQDSSADLPHANFEDHMFMTQVSECERVQSASIFNST